MTERLNLSRGTGLLLLLCTLNLTLFGNTSPTSGTAHPTPPDLLCPSDIAQVTLSKNLQRITGNLDENDGTISLSDFNCFQGLLQVSEGNHAYDLVTFSPNVTARYTFFLGTNFAGNASLYEGEFVLANPCQNLMGAINTSYTLPLPTPLPLPDQRLGFFLQAGETYSLIISNQEAGTSGNWELTAYNDAGGILSEFNNPSTHLLAFDLLWPDVKNIRFNSPQQWLVNADGHLDTAATLITYFDNDLEQFNKFLFKLSYTAMPVITSNCDLLLTLTDETTSSGGCGNIIITRTIQAQAVNNTCSNTTSSCQQNITFRRPAITDIQWPPREITIPCDEDFPTDGAVGGPDDNPAKEVTYAPTLLSAFGYRALPPSLGNLSTYYFDEPRIIVCDGSYKLRRQWRIGDWCAILGYEIFEQYIKIGDDVGPVLSNYQDTINISSSPFDCNAYIQIPTPDLLGDGNGCSAATLTNYVLRDTAGNFISSGNYPVNTPITLAVGEYKLIRCAEDDCGNETCIEATLLVRDEFLPTAGCPENVTVFIGGGDIANGIQGVDRLEAIDFFEGSNDNCGAITLEIRRNYWRNNTCDLSQNRWSPWGDYAWFYCCDFGTTITVELRVTDEAGNQRICTTTATVGDELAPYCYAPQDRTFHIINLPAGYPLDIATAYQTDFAATSLLMDDLFGGATGTDNCALDLVVEMTPLLQLNECGEGTITRRFQTWQAMIDADFSDGLQIEEVYASTNECVQTITIRPDHTFRIAFPADVYVDCNNPDAVGLEINAGDCDILAVNISESVIYPSTNDACYEMAITYDVINWSVWDGVADAYEIARITEDDGELWAAGYTVEPAERPIISLVASVGPDDENCDGILESFESSFSNLNDLRCTLTIDRSHSDEAGDSNIPDLTFDNIAETPASCIPTQNYGRYSYTQLVSVTNTSTPAITVADFGGPTAFCPNLASGQFGDYTGSCDAGVNISFSIGYDCAAHDELYSLTPLGTVFAELDTFTVDINGDHDITNDEFNNGWDVSEWIINNGDGSYTFSGTLPIITPAMGDAIFHALRIQFTDSCGQETSHIITFDVIDCKGPAPVCINGLTITLAPIPLGTDVDGDGINDTHMGTLNASDFEGSPISDCTGQGPDLFSGQPRVHRYAIYLAEYVASDPFFIPSPSDSTLLLTQEGEETTVVYVYAFDEEGNYDYCETYVLVQFANCVQPNCGTIQGTIATEDAQTIEGVSIDMRYHLYNWTDYRLSDSDGLYAFTHLNPYLGYTITPFLDNDYTNGITLADIDRLNDHLSGEALLTNPYQLIAADVDGSGTITDNDRLQLEQLLIGTIAAFPDNTSWRFINKAYIFPEPTNPWAEIFPESITTNELTTAVLNADFTGVKIGDIDGSVQGGFTTDENQLELAFISSEGAHKVFEVHQNTPNPFKAETLIGFHLPDNSEVSLTVTDLAGKLLFAKTGEYSMGYNSIQLTKDMLQGASGVLNYTIATAKQTVTKRMVVVW